MKNMLLSAEVKASKEMRSIDKELKQMDLLRTKINNDFCVDMPYYALAEFTIQEMKNLYYILKTQKKYGHIDISKALNTLDAA